MVSRLEAELETLASSPSASSEEEKAAAEAAQPEETSGAVAEAGQVPAQAPAEGAAAGAAVAQVPKARALARPERKAASALWRCAQALAKGPRCECGQAFALQCEGCGAPPPTPHRSARSGGARRVWPHGLGRSAISEYPARHLGASNSRERWGPEPGPPERPLEE